MGMSHWNNTEKQFVRDNADKLTIEQMSDKIGRSYTAVKLFLHRNRIPVGTTVKRNMTLELIRLRYKNPEDFYPSKAFYETLKFTPQRWWDLYLGKKQISETEYIALCDYLGVTLPEAFETRQLTFLED